MTEESSPVSLLQEVCQHSFWAPPVYATACNKGMYITDVYLSSLDLRTNGCGQSKKFSKHQAAMRMLNTIEEYLKSEKLAEYLSTYSALIEEKTNKPRKMEPNPIGEPAVRRCDTCDVTFVNPSSFTAHVSGKRHAKQEKAVEIMTQRCISDTARLKHHFCSQCGARCTGPTVCREDKDEQENLRTKPNDMFKTCKINFGKFRFEDKYEKHMQTLMGRCGKVSVGCQTEVDGLNKLSSKRQAESLDGLAASHDQTELHRRQRPANCLMQSATVNPVKHRRSTKDPSVSTNVGHAEALNLPDVPSTSLNFNRTGARPKRKVIFASYSSSDEEKPARDIPSLPSNIDHAERSSVLGTSLKINNTEIPTVSTDINCADARHQKQSQVTLADANRAALGNPTRSVISENTNHTGEKLAKEAPKASGKLRLAELERAIQDPNSLANRNIIEERPKTEVPRKPGNTNLPGRECITVPDQSSEGGQSRNKNRADVAMASRNINVVELGRTTKVPVQSANRHYLGKRISSDTTMPPEKENQIGDKPAIKVPKTSVHISRAEFWRIADAVMAISNATLTGSTPPVKDLSSANKNCTEERSASEIINRHSVKPTTGIPTASVNRIPADRDVGDDDSWSMATCRYSDKEIQSFIDQILKEISN